MLASRTRRWRSWAVMALAATALALVALTAPAAAATPSCSAVLFAPLDEAGAYMVEQPESVPGAIFCEPSLGTLEFSVADAPAHGTLSALEPNGLGGASFDYTPAPGFAGADSFALSARDGDDDPVTVRVDVSVRPASDDAPVCNVQLDAEDDGEAYLVEGGAAVTGSIDCFDDEGAELTFSVQAGPQHGTLSEIEPEGPDAASFTYTPNPAYEGNDSFSLVADDGTQDSDPAEVVVTVHPAVDDPPRCVATLATISDASGIFEVEQGETVHGAVSCVDEESAALDFAVGAPPSHGALAPLSPSGDGDADVAYTPAPGFTGVDSFRVDVSDGTNPATQMTVRVRVVDAYDDPPSCTAELTAPSVDGSFRVKQGATVTGELACDDEEGAPLEYATASPPQHGSLSPVGEDGGFTYSAPPSYVGSDELSLLANDGEQDSQPVVIEIEVVAAENEPPACEISLGAGAGASGAYLVDRNAAVQGRIVCSDDAGGELELTVAAAPLHGSLSALEQDGPGSAEFTYTPASGYVGPDAFTLAADDGEADPAPTPVALEVVEPSPDAPHCRARLSTADTVAGYEVESGETVSGMLTCFEANGSQLSFSVARAPDHGAIAGLEAASAGVARFTYAADGAWTGADGFALVAADGGHSSAPVEVEVTVVPPVDDPPVCAVSLFSERLPSGAYPAEEGEANPGVVACVDDEGDALTFSVAEPPQHGEITSLQGEGESAFFDYTADANHLGSDTASISVRDPAGGEDVLTLDLEVGPGANTAPVCTATLSAPLSAGTYRVKAGAPTAGEISCEDAELDTLGFGVAQPPNHGALSTLTGTGDSRSFIYTAASSYRGSDQFALEADDGSVDSALVVIALLVEAPDATSPLDRPGGGSAPLAPSAGGQPIPAAAPKTASCAQQRNQARARCLLEQRLTRSCGKLKGKAKATCAKRIRALAKCNAIKAKGKRGKARKKACKKQAQAIAKPAGRTR